MTKENLQRPYPPSWFDRLKAWVEHLPMPWWLFYLLAGLLYYPVMTITQWNAATYPIGSFSIFHLWLSLQLGYIPAMMHYLDKVAIDALAEMQSILKVGAEDSARFEYELVTLPARPTFWTSVLAAVLAVGVFMPVALLTAKDGFAMEYQMSTQPLSVLVVCLGTLLSWFFSGTLLVHTLRQLQMVNRIYRGYVQVDLFNLDPLYAFSGLTARTAILLLGIPYFWFATSPALVNVAASLAVGVIFAVIALITFVLPLWGIHQRLNQVKSRVMTDNRRRVNALVEDLARGVDAGDLGNASKIRDALTAFDLQYKTFEPIPTWPWRPDTFRLIVSAILLPTVLFLLQYILRRFLGG
jgi:hypothetical protein